MKYIAYGSNINLGQMEYRCPRSKVVCKGMLYGWKLVFNVHADIIYTGEMTDTVPVLVWDIAPEDWPFLDRYEGFPKYYVKKEIETHFENGASEKCIAYVMAKDRRGYSTPYEGYFHVILEGYRENKMDEEYLYKALEETRENIRHNMAM